MSDNLFNLDRVLWLRTSGLHTKSTHILMRTMVNKGRIIHYSDEPFHTYRCEIPDHRELYEFTKALIAEPEVFLAEVTRWDSMLPYVADLESEIIVNRWW